MDSHLENLQRALVDAAAGTPEEMSWHPPGGKWCAAEVLEHLYLTYTGTAKGFENVLLEGKPLATAQAWKHRVQTLVVLKFNYLPEGRKAPPRTMPKGLAMEKVLAEIPLRLAEMDALITRCEGQFGTNCKMLDHPVLGPLTAMQWRKFHFVHGMHHIKQIRNLRQMRGKTAKN